MTAAETMKLTRVEILEKLLDQISVSADTLANFAAIHGAAGGGAASYNMHAVQAMAERIGALASIHAGALRSATHLAGFDLAVGIVAGNEARDAEQEGCKS